MFEYFIVIMIVFICAGWLVRRYVKKMGSVDKGCCSGCSSCGSDYCGDTTERSAKNCKAD